MIWLEFSENRLHNVASNLIGIVLDSSNGIDEITEQVEQLLVNEFSIIVEEEKQN